MMFTVTACGEDAGGAGGAGTGGSDATESTRDGSQGGGGQGGGAEVVDPATLPDSGGITVWQNGHDSGVAVQFQRGRDAGLGADQGCEERAVGSCTARRCGPSTPSTSDTRYLDAGEVSLTGAAQEVSLERDDRGGYWWEGTGPLLSSSSAISVAGSGADVPAFSVAVPTPARLRDVVPAMNGTFVPADEDLTISWSFEGTGGLASAWLITSAADGRLDDVICSADPAAGGVTVPVELLDWLEVDGGFNALVFTAASHHVAVGTHDVRVTGQDYALVGGGRFE